MKKKNIIALVLKFTVAVCAVLGTVLSVLSSAAFMGGGNVFMYFTIQSNILVALIAVCGAVFTFTGKAPDCFGIIKYVGAVAITLTGVVFCAVLAPTMGAAAWNAKNVLTHAVVPVAAVAEFFVGGDVLLKKRDALWCVVPPLLYVVYAAVGYVCNWIFSSGNNYPYFFLNWGSEAGAFGFSPSLPFMGCFWWILLLLGFIIGVAFGYRAAANALNREKK